MPKLSNTQHEIFVREIVKGGTQGDAYLAAGYKAKNTAVASAAATRLLKDVSVQARLAELHGKAEVKAILTLEQHMEKLSSLRDKAEEANQLSAAIKAEELRGKLRRFYIEQTETGKPGDFSRASDEELDDIIASEAEVIAPAPRRTNGHAKH